MFNLFICVTLSWYAVNLYQNNYHQVPFMYTWLVRKLPSTYLWPKRMISVSVYPYQISVWTMQTAFWKSWVHIRKGHTRYWILFLKRFWICFTLTRHLDNLVRQLLDLLKFILWNQLAFVNPYNIRVRFLLIWYSLRRVAMTNNPGTTVLLNDIHI